MSRVTKKLDSFSMHALPREYQPPVPENRRLTKTRTVIMRETGGEAVINTRDFDPLLHELPGAKVTKPATAKLEALTLTELRELSTKHAVDLGEATKKADVVATLAAAGVSG